MPPLSVDFLDSLPWRALAGPLARAEDALARLDERLRASPIRHGWIERTHFSDACASLWIEGELAHLEDLVLHDAHMDARAPTPELLRAARVLAARRQILGAAAGWALSPAGLATLRGGGFLPEGEGSVPPGRPVLSLEELLVKLDRVLEFSKTQCRFGLGGAPFD